jgi:hypothetical protein
MRIVTAFLLGLACSMVYGADATFVPLNPVPQVAAVSPDTVAPGGTATLSYSAALASQCAVTQSGCATAPTIPAATCVGVGGQLTCSASVTVSVPAAAAPCSDEVTVACQPGNVLSKATLTIASGPPPPGDCSGLKPLPTPVAGKNWKQVLQSRVKWGDGTLSGLVNAGDYLQMWSYPGTTPDWPGASGGTTRPTGASPYMFFSEKFVVPASALGLRIAWSWAGSGTNSNASAVISSCSGDFGQLGSKSIPYCKMNKNTSSSGMRATIALAQDGANCTLRPGGTYYINFLPEGNLPKNPYDLSVSYCDSQVLCSPWFSMTK